MGDFFKILKNFGRADTYEDNSIKPTKRTAKYLDNTIMSVYNGREINFEKLRSLRPLR